MSNKRNKSNNINWRMAVAGFSYVSLAVTPVYASDVEIYTTAVASSSLSPVVMMMLDTSGSMQWCVDSSSSSACSDNSKRRDVVLKNAVREVLTGANPAPGYVKMGLSRYQNDGDDGGWVVYPARPLDAIVAIAPDGVVSNPVPLSGGDTSGASGLTSTQLKFVTGNDVGVYFSKVLVPKKASIRNAYIEFTADSNDANTATWQIGIEDTGNAQVYSSTNTLGNSSRSYELASNSQVIDSWTAGSTYKVDVKELVQKVAGDRDDWCGGNAMAFRLREVGTGQRRAYSWDGSNSKAPKLVVEYSVDPEADDSCIKLENQSTFFYTGMQPSGIVNTTQAKYDDVRWTEGGTSVTSGDNTLNINTISSGKKYRIAVRMTSANAVPKGATINSATLRVTGANTNTSQNTAVRFFKQTNMGPICTGSGCTKPNDVDTALTSAISWPGRTFATDTVYPIDVKTIVASAIAGSSDDEVTGLTVLMHNATTTSSSAGIRSANSSIQGAAYLEVNWSGTVTNLSRMTTVRDELTKVVEGIPANANTPLGAAYSETARYLVGKTPHMFSDGDSTLPSNPDSRTWDGTKYKSPLNTSDKCSGNYIFLLTDGAPTAVAGVTANVQAITNRSSCALPSGYTVSGTSQTEVWRCMMDLADTLVTPSKNPLGVSIKTNSVFLGPDATANEKANMGKVSTLGGGNFYTADSTQDIVDALTRTIADAISNNGMIASPGVAVNQFNRLNSLDQVYFVLFDPTRASKRWDGNLKRFKLDVAGEQVVDVNGLPAFNSDGSFKRDSQSFWSTSPDGGDSTAGGAASKLPHPSVRKIFTHVGGTGLTKLDVADSGFVSQAMPLMPAPANTDEDIFKNLMNWYRGYDISDAYSGLISDATLATVGERKKMGGGLHSRASLINYGYTGTDPANADNQKNIVFFSTLGATLHGINAKTGVEEFAFIPGEKLGAIKTLYDNPGSSEPEYGLDLSWTVYREDSDANGQINPGEDKVYLYGGMRMGGRNYYGLDLTSLTSPKMLFTIKGGVGAYGNLGQTWSQPVVTEIKDGTTVKKVLIFGGGYDPCWEDGTCLATMQGNQLYIVDAETGALIWWASGAGAPTASPAAVTVSGMTYSIPSQPKVLDLNADGLADTIYFGDLGGQVFRADIDNGKSGTELVKRVKIVAKLGSNGVVSPTAADARRIYEPPAVALFKDATMNKIFAAVAVGTGNRSRPLNTAVQDRFAVVFDYDVFRPDLLTVADSSLQATMKFSNMVALDLGNAASTGTPTYTMSGGTYTPGTYGWYVNLSGSGEKSMSPGIIFFNKLAFTTYLPIVSATGCAVVVGYTNMYELCMPYGNQCNASTPRKVENIMMGMAGEPQLVYQQSNVLVDGVPVGDLGKLTGGLMETEKTGLTKRLQSKQRWREKTRQE